MFTDHLQCAAPKDWMHDFSQCLYEWQTLLGAGLASIAAYLSVKWIRRQIEQDKLHHTDEISRRHNATRLTLPLALASIQDLILVTANEISAKLEGHFERERKKAPPDWIDEVFAAADFAKITVDSAILTSLKDFVETLQNPADIRHIAELVSSLQIYISRYNGFDPLHADEKMTLNSLLLDAAKIQLLTDTIYNYARFVDDESFGIVSEKGFAEIWDEIHGKAQGLIFLRQRPDDFFPAFAATIDSSKANNVSPWNEKFRS